VLLCLLSPFFGEMNSHCGYFVHVSWTHVCIIVFPSPLPYFSSNVPPRPSTPSFSSIHPSIHLPISSHQPQEGKAEDAADAIKSMLSPKCVVLRDGGSRASLESKELVPGDIIFLQPGDCVPADARLLGRFHHSDFHKTKSGIPPIIAPFESSISICYFSLLCFPPCSHLSGFFHFNRPSHTLTHPLAPRVHWFGCARIHVDR
jgi:hypothetical protein